MALLDEHPYPVGKLPAQELVRTMAGFYRTQREAEPFIARFGIDPLDITPNLSAINLWFELMLKLAVQGRVRSAVEATRDQFPSNPRAPFLDALLADRDAPVDAEPVTEDDPAFDDRVSAPEALLFHDDLTMPTGRLPGLIATLRKMVELAPAVCLLRIENIYGVFSGTGFRITDDLILTNHHVLFPRGRVATSVRADFGFDIDVEGASTVVTSLAGSVDSIVGEQADDWAVVAVPGMAPNWPKLSLERTSSPRPGDAVYILQHPGGQQRRLGFVRNTISDVDEGTVRYLTDTEPGSSGAPVLDRLGRLVALHHAGGRPTEVAGKPPVSKNEGIRISRVIERMKATAVIE
ncbi:trypsin-like peptidase domain-containing protein [Mesorhizobium sp. M0895]|uniref:trypsin-like peptidase domain-containing protein n=1 Tax=Mesorhizobium sp. M0895 TaxID=2957019 RepID=UPI0033364C3C